MCANKSTQWKYVDCNKAASLTTITELHTITSVIDAKQKRDIVTANIPIAFVQTDAVKKTKSKHIIATMTRALVRMLVQISMIELWTAYECCCCLAGVC